MICSLIERQGGYLNIPDSFINCCEAWRLESDSKKIVVGNQLKTVIGEVMPYSITTKSGLKVDAKFGAKSFAARIVSSLLQIGVIASTLEVVTKEAIKAYRK